VYRLWGTCSALQSCRTYPKKAREQKNICGTAKKQFLFGETGFFAHDAAFKLSKKTASRQMFINQLI
jgi:hypothetical protein